MKHPDKAAATPLSLDKLAVVILHYGDAALTDRLARDMHTADPEARLFVLDNAAPQPYPADSPGCRQRLPENLYWAGALEYAALRAARENFTHIWFLNNDISFPNPGPRARLAVERVNWLQRATGAPVAVYSPAMQRNPYMPHMVWRSRCEAVLAPYADGVAPLLDLACLEAIGGPDCADNPFGYGVDIWLSLRAYQAGFTVAIDQRLLIKHSHHTTARKQDGFLKTAAQAEESFMSTRLGKNWRDQLNTYAAHIKEL